MASLDNISAILPVREKVEHYCSTLYAVVSLFDSL